jgi:hypothetical protein
MFPDRPPRHDHSPVIDFAKFPVLGRRKGANSRRMRLRGVASRVDLVLKDDYGAQSFCFLRGGTKMALCKLRGPSLSGRPEWRWAPVKTIGFSELTIKLAR